MLDRFARTRAWAAAPLAALLAVGALADGSAFAATRQGMADPLPAGAAAVPFAPGERAEYQVKLGAVSVGSGSMQVVGIENVHGKPTYHTRLRISGGIPLARVDDKFDSWIDVVGLFSRRFKQDQKEVRFERNRTYEFFPERREYRRLDNGETGSIPTDRPLDDVSFLYYARTLPLKVGETYTLNRYFKADGNPVVLRVLRRDTVRVPAGTFRTLVIRPVIKTDGLFGEGGDAEVHLSDDDRRIVVQIRSRVPVIGSLTMHLREYRAGTAPR
ncbi:MAG TPA: DUF3108 domain-containing protein [Longimicrobiaceae bacterium]|nr:DUF3108 domain-containing protein [Longimicrobiaceae bacterium]